MQILFIEVKVKMNYFYFIFRSLKWKWVSLFLSLPENFKIRRLQFCVRIYIKITPVCQIITLSNCHYTRSNKK
jgi:hypothetical protein